MDCPQSKDILVAPLFQPDARNPATRNRAAIVPRPHVVKPKHPLAMRHGPERIEILMTNMS